MYDLIIDPEPGIEYGILKGPYYSNRVVFIKLPHSSNCYGYWNKYSNLAKELRSRFGYHVICAENHEDELSKKYDIEVLKQYVTEEKFNLMDYKLIGIGDGAIFGLSYLCHQIDFKKMLLINMPISYELGETIDLLNKVDRKNIKFVYGDEDSSYRFTPLLKRLYADVITIKGADHNFTGMTNKFVNLYKLVL